MNLESLFEKLKELSPDGLQGITYNLTHRNRLDDDWWVFMPGTWDNQPPETSPLEEAIISGLNDPLVSQSEKLFIDIAHLGPYGSSSFFENAPNILDKLRELIPNQKNITIRYLEGNIASQFKRNGDGNSNPIARQLKKLVDENPAKVSLYFGSLAPDFELCGDEIADEIDTIWDDVFAYLSENHPPIWTHIGENEKDLRKLCANLIKGIIEYPFSWNHAKIFAINGVWLLQGGANYWVDYEKGKTTPFDLSMKINGDCAIDAHNFCNYLWGFMASNQTKYISCQEYKNGRFENTVSPPNFDQSPENQGNIKVLTTNELGLWPGSPISYLIIDVITNLLWPTFVNNRLEHYFPKFCQLLYGGSEKKLAYSAGRYIRKCAIAGAQSDIVFSQQKFVMDDLLQAGEWFSEFLKRFNDILFTNWDGMLWDFELIEALATAIKKNDNLQCVIVASYYITNDDHGGYQDPITSKQFMDMVSLFAGKDVFKMKFIYNRISNSNSIGNHSKLISIDSMSEGNSLLYIGSQNAYVSYNQEFGVWIEDRNSIVNILNDYWRKLQDKSIKDH